MQLLAVVKSPKEHEYPVSTEQVLSQPSFALVFPSSQYPAVGLTTFPSPHISFQLLAVDESPRVHSHNDSTAQLESQPSPSVGFPSSQYPTVGLITIPSPQVSEQLLAVLISPNVQVYPVSTEQEPSHPSLGVVPPSSQYPAVGLTTFPSPQMSEQAEAVDESPRVQVHKLSTAQLASHPSPGFVFPSSQYPAEGLITIPSPHVSVHELAVEESPSVQVYPASTAHVELHPSLSTVLPSSQ